MLAGDHGRFVLRGKGTGFDTQIVADAPALIISNAVIGGVVPALGNGRNRDVALAVANTLACVVQEVTIAVGEKATF